MSAAAKRDYDAARYQRQRSAVLARVAAYRAAHKAEVAARDRAYKAAHPHRHTPGELAYNREWKRRHADEVVAYMGAYRRAQPLRYRGYVAKRRAARRATMTGPVDYDAILVRDSGRCGICTLAVAPADLHFDHVVPLSRGGAHVAENIQVAHRQCNLRKGARCS